MPWSPSTSDQMRASAIWPTAAAPWLSSSLSCPRGNFSRPRPSAIEPEDTTSTSRPSPCSLARSAANAFSHDARSSPLAESINSDDPTLTTMRRKFFSAGRFMAIFCSRRPACASGTRRSSARWLFQGAAGSGVMLAEWPEGSPMNRREFVTGSLALSVTAPAWAQAGPLTKIIFPFAAGGSGDMLCRQLAEYLPAALDRKFIVENRTGGDGLIGIRAVKGSAPDTTTILVTTGPTMYLLPMVENQPSFDSARDFVPVSQLARFEFVVVVSPSIGVADFKQLAAWIKAHPAKASYGVPSSGTIPHF